MPVLNPDTDSGKRKHQNQPLPDVPQPSHSLQNGQAILLHHLYIFLLNHYIF